MVQLSEKDLVELIVNVKTVTENIREIKTDIKALYLRHDKIPCATHETDIKNLKFDMNDSEGKVHKVEIKTDKSEKKMDKLIMASYVAIIGAVVATAVGVIQVFAK